MGGRVATHVMDISYTPRRLTRETHFSMTYESEAVIPLEVGFRTLRIGKFIREENDRLLCCELRINDEKREIAMIRMVHYQQKLRQGYDKKDKSRPLAPGDLVLKKVVGTTKNPLWGKVGPNWEGPYRITLVAGNGAYYLEDLDEKVISHPWM
ncbi:uncharacterized protein LOC142634311 [Castanea sativa]|uniref:uncharacterized protein LOC142634311 n=1 Tax=Castanea sativa TaxID=21020 RepID=UPI003F64C891